MLQKRKELRSLEERINLQDWRARDLTFVEGQRRGVAETRRNGKEDRQ